jgi:hypothetical protein
MAWPDSSSRLEQDRPELQQSLDHIAGRVITPFDPDTISGKTSISQSGLRQQGRATNKGRAAAVYEGP